MFLGELLCRFDGKDFFERMRGKTILFVGDSISLNQRDSLACLLHAAVPNIAVSSNNVEFKVGIYFFCFFFFAFFLFLFFFPLF